jgi:hypothetical protein
MRGDGRLFTDTSARVRGTADRTTVKLQTASFDSIRVTSKVSVPPLRRPE